MIFQLLWALIGVLCVFGYLFLWLQQKWARIQSSTSRKCPIEPIQSHYWEPEPVSSAIYLPDSMENFPEEKMTNLDDDDDENQENNGEQSQDVTDLDEMDTSEMPDPRGKGKLHYERSFDVPNEDEEADLLTTDDNDLSFLKSHKFIVGSKYYAICTIKSERNLDFVKITEGDVVNIEDVDNFDYWSLKDEHYSDNFAIIPRCCVSTSSDRGMMSEGQSKKRNTRETFREDILKISNKNQESTMKRKYALADMIECDREYCATLKLINDILASLDSSSNDFGDKIDSLFERILKIMSTLLELHENDILPKLSACVMNPAKVANVIVEQKTKLYIYSDLQSQWSSLKNQLNSSKKKHIFLQNNNTNEKSKFSIVSFNDLMKKSEEKISQYIGFLNDIMRYTGRVEGDIYDLQKAITVFSRIKRYGKERNLLKKLTYDTEISISKERVVRMTENVMISETEILKSSNENLNLISEEICSTFLLKNHLICVNNNTELIRNNILDLNYTKIFTKDNYEGPNEVILWSKTDKIKYRIFIFYFPTRFSKLGWLHDITTRLKKKGVERLFVSSAEYDDQYKQYLDKYQRLAAIEMESVSLESASLDNDCSSIYDQLEDATSIAESTSEIKFESALTELPSSITSGSYKTAPEALKSSTNKANRPISGISQDSISTLDGVRTPFSDEESLKYISIVSDVEEINVPKGENLAWSLKIMNFDSTQHEILWSLSGKIIDFDKTDASVEIAETSDKVFECIFKKPNVTKLENGQLTCKIIDKINSTLIVAKTVNVFLQVSSMTLDIICESKEVTVSENDKIAYRLNVLNQLLKDSFLKHLIWYKDNEKLDLKDPRISFSIDSKNSQLLLIIDKASISDAGIYTLNCSNNYEIRLKETADVSILLLVEKRKKTIFKTASQESQVTVDDHHIHTISPMKETATLGNDSDEHSVYENAITSVTQITEQVHPLISAFWKNVEVNEFTEARVKVMVSTKLKEQPKWFFNNTIVKQSDNINLAYNSKDNNAELVIRKCDRSLEGIYKCVVTDPVKKTEESVDIHLSVIRDQTSGFLDCEIAEIDLKVGETLSLNLKTNNIPLSTLKNGSWYLDTERLDVKKLKGSENISESEVSICIPDVTKSVAGILQYRIDKPVKIYSSEILIKVRGTPQKKDAKSPEEIKSFISAVKDKIEVIEFNEARLKVNISLKLLTPPKWFSNNTIVKQSDNINLEYNSKDNNAELVIRTCDRSLEGIYKCVVTDPVKKTEESVDIHLSVIRDQTSGFLDCEIAEIDLKVGETLLLKLKSNNIPLSTLKDGSWYLDSERLDVKKLKGSENISESEVSICIPDVTKSVAGILQYRIDKPVKIYSSEIIIKVRGNITNKDILAKGEEQENIIKIELNNVHVNVLENEDAVLLVKIISGNIKLYRDPQWFINNEPLKTSNYNMFFKDATAQLIIKNCRIFDGGQYKIEFSPIDEKKCNSVSGIFIVTVGAIEKTLKAIETDVKATEGESVTICVDVVGFLEKDIKWKVEGKNIRNENSFQNERILQKFNNNLSFLLIDRVQVNDSGKYVCQGFANKELISECHINLTVSKSSVDDLDCGVSFEKDVYDIEEGEDIVLRANIICSSTHYSVSWFFNCKSLEMKSDLSSDIKYNGKVAELNIKNCKLSSNGFYDCTIESKDGHTAAAKTELRIRSRLQNIPKNSIKVERNHYEIIEGNEMNLELFCYKDYDVEVKWSKEEVDLKNDPEYQKIRSENKLTLFKKEASVLDSGSYECRILKNKTLEETINFTVIVHPRDVSESNLHPRLKLICDNNNIILNPGDPLIISIEVLNWTSATVEWLRNDEPFGESYHLDNQFIDLYVEHPVPALHCGKYICLVTNENNDLEKVDIQVDFANEMDTIFEEGDFLSCTVESVDSEENEKIELSIESKLPTKSLGSYEWYKDNKPINENDPRLTIIVQPFCYNLILRSVKLSDAGTYSLRVNDNSMDIDVRVRRKPVKRPTKEIFKILKAPIVKKALQDIVIIKEPETVKFEFEIEECGPTKAVWFFENEEIEVENAEFIQWSCDNFFALTIPAAGERHCGKYMIQVTNDMGCLKNDARLSLSLKAETPVQLIESCCIAPMFTKKLTNVDVGTKENIRLNCRIMSDPKPKILWTKDGETLDPKIFSKRIKILDDFPNYYLTILDGAVTDSGRYCCLATNFLGYDTTEADVIINENDDKDDKFEDNSNLILVKPQSEPVLTVDFSKNADVILSWTSVTIKDGVNVTYSIEKQKSLTSTKWKKILKNLTNTTCSLSSLYLSLNEPHTLRCVATSEYGFDTISNVIEIPIRASAPILLSDKPTIVFKDATCAKLSWSRGRCKDLSIEESIGKVFYCLEMKDNPKSSWQIVSNELTNNEYSMPLEPGVSYMFRVTAFNDYGISEPSQSLISRLDRLKLVPDFSLEPPWLHVKGQPCLKWRAAIVPEYCESCVPGIAPDYKVEYRNGRLSPWKIYQENITESKVYLTQNIIEAAQEFRVSCRNKFGQNGPTRSYRLQANIVSKPSTRSPSVEKTRNIITYDTLKSAEIVSLSCDGLNLKWDPWLPDKNNKYIIQKKNFYNSDWDQVQSIIFGEDCFLELPLSENFSRQLKILALEENKSDFHDGYNIVTIPSKNECIPTTPENVQVFDLNGYHEIKWSESTCHKLIDCPISYTLQCKTGHQYWFTLVEKLEKCSFKNSKIDKFGVTTYRVLAKNALSFSGPSKEVSMHSLINVLSNEQVIKSIRYFVINCEEIEIKWHLCESIFDNDISADELSFQIEKKFAKETSNWTETSAKVFGNSIIIPITFQESLFRIQPFYNGEKLSPSRIFRIFISKDLLVPDMSLMKPKLISDSVTDFVIEWTEPDLQSGFSPESNEICIPSALLIDMQYEVQYVVLSSNDNIKNRSKDIKRLNWIELISGLEENSFHWESPDPSQEYMFRIIASNQFGSGIPSQIVKLHPQITIPDFSFVRLNMEDIVIPGTNGKMESILSWTPPRMSSDLYTPFSVDVQYREMSMADANNDDWIVLKQNIKKNRVDISELDPNMNYQLRIVPVTDFGRGKPSMITKRIRNHDYQKNMFIENKMKYPDRPSTTSEVFCCLSQNAELKFTKLVDYNVDQIYWTFNKSEINMNDEKYKIYSAESYGIYFVVKNLEAEDFGEYCALNNSQEVIQSFILIKSDAPTFLNCLPNRSLNLHENLFISIQIDAQPPPEVVWRRNWKKMFSSYRTVISENKETGIYSLLISKCILSDSGEYSIRAENAAGFAEIKFNLRIDAQPERKSVQINEGDINDRYYTMRKLTKGSYSTCQILIEKSTECEFIGKFFDVNNIGVGNSEFLCIQNINNRNIVEIFDAISMADQYLVLVYEKLQGLSLVEYLSGLNHWCESQIRPIIHQLIQAAAHLHHHRISHLDIKPENIIMTGKYNEIVKLCGFSNAVREEDFRNRRHVFTTSPFSAPELLKGEPVHFNSDIWSIGILTFLCFHGHVKVDFEGEKLSTENGSENISNFASDFVKKCLVMETGRRLKSFDGVNHEWFTSRGHFLDAALDDIVDQTVNLMTYPEEMVPNFPTEMKDAIETFLINSRPKVTFNNSLTNLEDSVSPPISQVSSRASSASRDGINYESCDQSGNIYANEKSEKSEMLQGIDRHFVSNTTKELLFTVPLKDQTFRISSSGEKFSVTLTCQLSLLGSEPISISWYRNQELLTDDSKIKLEVIKGGFLSCVISNTSENDVGIYRCVARCHSLRTETCARLLIGDVPSQPEQVTITHVNQNGILLKWKPNLSAIDDIIYRIDIKVCDSTSSWKTIGYSVDNRYLLEDLGEGVQFIARIIAQNKYGYSSYSIATAVFQINQKIVYTLKQPLIFNRKWMLSSRQSNTLNDLHDLIKDITPEDIRMNIIQEHYSSTTEAKRAITILKLKNHNVSFPDYIVQRTFKSDDTYPAIDLCTRIKYYHFPIIYGELRDSVTGYRTTYEEYVPGGNLLSVLLARYTYSEFSVHTIIRQLLETVQFLHSNNIVHANIDPSNILVARRTNQLFDIKLIGLETCQFIGTVSDLVPQTTHKTPIFKAPEFRYESITKSETDIWSLGVLTFLLLATKLPAIEDACSDSDVQCCVKNTKTLLLPTTHSHIRAPKLSLLHRFSKGARKFVHNSLKKNPSERGNADYWLTNTWFKLDPQAISSMELQTISALPLAEFVNNNYNNP